MEIRRLCLVVVLTASMVVTVLQAQNVPIYSLHMLDRYQFNPAFAGMESSLSMTAAYRTQWLGIPGNPVQYYVNGHLPFYLWNGAIGFSVMHESIGAQKMLNATVSYNYVMETDVGLFSAGLGAGITQQSLDGSILRAPDGDYEGPTIIHNDPILPNTLVRGIAPLFQLGIYYAGNSFEAGIAVKNYTPGNVKLEDIEIQDKAAINFFAEYFIESLGDVSIYPTLFITSDFVQTQTSVAVRVEFRDFIMFGVGVRGYSANTLDAATLMVGLKLSERMNVYYNFDLGLSALSSATRGSHEVMLRYNLHKVVGAGLPPPVIYSPRF